MQLRRYRSEDAGPVRDLFARINRGLAPPGMEAAFEAYIDRSIQEEIGRIPDYYGEGPGRGFWVAVDEAGTLQGFFGLELAGADGAELRRMYVAPEARRQGLARRMLTEAEAECAAAGLRRLVLSTSELQDAAVALYRRAGYDLVREEIADAASNKTIGGGIRRFHFEKRLGDDLP
jgi:putative acetyltransferase